MVNARFFSCSVSFLVLPVILFALTGCGQETSLLGKRTMSETPEAPVPVVDSEQPVLNPQGTAGPSEAVVIFPNGRERLEVGRSYEITWESKGFNKIDIGLEENGYGRGDIAEGVLAAEGKFLWTPSFGDGIQDNHIMNLQIVLSDSKTGNVLDKSDDSFIIVEATPK